MHVAREWDVASLPLSLSLSLSLSLPPRTKWSQHVGCPLASLLERPWTPSILTRRPQQGPGFHVFLCVYIWFVLFFFGGWFCHFIFKRDVTRERTPASERGVERNPLGGFAQRRGVRQDVPKTPSDGTLRRRSRGCDEKGAGGEIPLFFFVKKLSLRAAQEEAKSQKTFQ